VLKISELFKCAVKASDRVGILEFETHALVRANQRGVEIGLWTLT